MAQYCMAGADGWLSRPIVPAELAHAVQAAAHGRPVLSPEAERALMDFLHEVGVSLSHHGLTRREREVVGCLGENLSNKELGRRLGIATDTVHVHLGHLFEKLGVHSREQLVRKLLGGDER
jgi:DNA-binding NarL/FixJ family response regulator